MTHNFKFISLAVAALISIAFVSCNSKEDDGPTLYDFMLFSTLESISDNGCSFEVQKNSETAPVILTSSVQLDKSTYKAGNRYVIRYSCEANEPFVAGPISLSAVLGCFSDTTVFSNVQEISDLSDDIIDVMGAELVGKWLNMTAVAPLIAGPKTFGAYVNEETLENEYPDVYVVFVSDNNSSYNRYQFFGSFDISNLIDINTVRGITLHYPYNGYETTARFNIYR